jgi:hypothetical protein
MEESTTGRCGQHMQKSWLENMGDVPFALAKERKWMSVRLYFKGMLYRTY